MRRQTTPSGDIAPLIGAIQDRFGLGRPFRTCDLAPISPLPPRVLGRRLAAACRAAEGLARAGLPILVSAGRSTYRLVEHHGDPADLRPALDEGLDWLPDSDRAEVDALVERLGSAGLPVDRRAVLLGALRQGLGALRRNLGHLATSEPSCPTSSTS